MKFLIIGIFLFNSTSSIAFALTERELLGEYVVNGTDAPLHGEFTLAKDHVAITKLPIYNNEIVRTLFCQGTYRVDLEGSDLTIDFSNCDRRSFSHRVFLQGATLEKLRSPEGFVTTTDITIEGELFSGISIKINRVD